jgi:hypothetical protein
MEADMLQRGDIVVERLTGRRAIVIQVSGEEMTCRFPDGRLEDRFQFEVEPALPLLESLLSLVMSLFVVRTPTRSAATVGERVVRPLLVRQPGAS